MPDTTVCIACRLASGLVLRTFEPYPDPDLAGVIHHRETARFELRGTGGHAAGIGVDVAVTEDVPRGIWEIWLKDNAGNPALTNRQVYEIVE